MSVAARELTLPSFESAPPSASSELGAQAVRLAASAGLVLDPWQEYALQRILAEDAGLRPAAFEVGLIVPRQNGKGAVLEALSLAWLFLTDAPLILHSAHEFKTAAEAFRRLRALLQRTPKLWSRVSHVTTAAGNEAVELRTGQRLRYVARSKGSGRGFTAGKLILDEAYAIEAEEMAAMLPTLATQPEGQIVYTSSAGMTGSSHLRSIRDRGRPGGDPSLCYLEWGGVAECEGDCRHELDDGSCALNDRRLWLEANPSWGVRIPEEFIDKERRALGAPEFARERLGVWDQPAGSEAAFGMGKWEACVGDAAPAGTRLGALAAAVSFDQSWGAVGGAAHAGDTVYVKPLQHGPGTGWLVDRCVELQQRHDVEVVVDGRGPAAELIPDLVKAKVRLRVAETADVLDACAGIFAAVQDRRLRHQAFPELDAAVGGAVKRPVGDRWAWGRRQSTSDISVLETVTLAAWAARRVEPEVRPMVAVR